MLKQGKPRGIFGRGVVVKFPARSAGVKKGVNPWSVLLRFDALVDPTKSVLLSERQLLALPAEPHRWNTQSSGVSLEPAAAREIDKVIDSIAGVGASSREMSASYEQERQMRIAEQSSRPGQQKFRIDIRKNYEDRCAVTGCSVPQALDAAHIRVEPGKDDNSLSNGLLLRADIHALFDALLITLSEDGRKLELNEQITDTTYEFLRNVKVFRPRDLAPSDENIRDHRRRFFQKNRREQRIQKIGVRVK